jgi:GAF domain-containing protein
VTIADALALGPSEEAADSREARAAVAIAGGLYVVGALLCATALLLPHVGSPLGVVGVALDALLTGCALCLAAAHRRGGLGMAFAADVWGVIVIAVLCASGGGAGSPFALIYFFAIGHAAAFQPVGRLTVLCLAGLLAFLAPLIYESHVSSLFGAIALVGIVLALLAAVVIHLALGRMREQRRRLEILIAATSELDKSLDPAETLRTIARMAVPDLASLCVIDVLDEDGWAGTTVAASADPRLAAEIERCHEQRPPDTDPERLVRDAGYHASAVLAMSARGRTHGTISFWQRRGEPARDAGLLAVLEDLTGRAAMALDNARLYAERALVARTLRRSLMPAVLPSIAGLELASYFRPMGAGDEVGGDFYDVFGDPESCWLVIGDVCGKGAEAAALTGFLRHTIAAYARADSSPREVLAEVNRAMLDQDFDGCFATAVLAHLRLAGAGAEATIALAGHPPVLLVRAAGGVSEFGGAGTLLGVVEEPGFEEARTLLAQGDALVLYTDGLIEAHAPERVLSPEAMIGSIERGARGRAQAPIDSLLALIDLNGRVRDDIAILAATVSASGDQTS